MTYERTITFDSGEYAALQRAMQNPSGNIVLRCYNTRFDNGMDAEVNILEGYGDVILFDADGQSVAVSDPFELLSQPITIFHEGNEYILRIEHRLV